MKKYFLLFAAGGLLTLASCGGETKPTEAPINADSLAKAKVDSATAAMKAENEAAMAAREKAVSDSLAMVAQADSIANAEKAAIAAKNSKTAAKKVVAKKPTTKVTPPTPPPPPPSKQDTKFDQRNGTNTQISEQKAKEQDDKFNRRK